MPNTRRRAAPGAITIRASGRPRASRPAAGDPRRLPASPKLRASGKWTRTIRRRASRPNIGEARPGLDSRLQRHDDRVPLVASVLGDGELRSTRRRSSKPPTAALHNRRGMPTFRGVRYHRTTFAAGRPPGAGAPKHGRARRHPLSLPQRAGSWSGTGISDERSLRQGVVRELLVTAGALGRPA